MEVKQSEGGDTPPPIPFSQNKKTSGIERARDISFEKKTILYFYFLTITTKLNIFHFWMKA